MDVDVSSFNMWSDSDTEDKPSAPASTSTEEFVPSTPSPPPATNVNDLSGVHVIPASDESEDDSEDCNAKGMKSVNNSPATKDKQDKRKRSLAQRLHDQLVEDAHAEPSEPELETTKESCYGRKPGADPRNPVPEPSFYSRNASALRLPSMNLLGPHSLANTKSSPLHAYGRVPYSYYMQMESKRTQQPVPVVQTRRQPSVIVISDDETDADDENENISSDSSSDMEVKRSSRGKQAKADKSKHFKDENSSKSDETTRNRQSGADTSTPLPTRRTPFASIDNLNITAIEKDSKASNFNESTADITDCLLSDEAVNEVQSGLGNLSIVDGSGDPQKKKPLGFNEGKERNGKLLNNREHEQYSSEDSDSDSSVDSVSTVRHNRNAVIKQSPLNALPSTKDSVAILKEKAIKKPEPDFDVVECSSSEGEDVQTVNILSSEDEADEVIDLENTEASADSVESVNSLFDAEASEESWDEEPTVAKVQKKKITAKPKVFGRDSSPVPSTSRGTSNYFDDEASEDSWDEEYTVSKGQKIKTSVKLKLPGRDQAPVPSTSRGFDRGAVKYEFNTSVKKTIEVLARIIDEMPVPDDDNQDVERPDNMKVDLYKHQLYGLKWLCWREQQYPGGGILADEMGLGKTVMILSLVLKTKSELGRPQNRDEDEWNSQEKSKRKLVPSQSTLVICPPGMLGQWESEILTKTKRMSVLVFHGPKRQTSAAVMAQYDFVLTTYPTLCSEIPKNITSRSPLIKIHWERIVLDEGHIIRNSKTLAAYAVGTLNARYRWVVTGTPVHNSTMDMYSLVSFLRLEPFNDKKVWEFWIGFKGLTLDQSARLHTIGKSLLLRRTKDEVNVQDPGRQIPPKTVIDVEVELTESERLVYDHLADFAKERFKNFLINKEQREQDKQAAGDNYVAGARKARSGASNDFTHMFTLILRLRQASVLPFLIHTMLDDDDEEEDHDTSREIENIISTKNPCFKNTFLSAKIMQLLRDINKLRVEAKEQQRHMDKVLVVSQWVSLLDIVTMHLVREGYSVASITGKNSLDERTEAMKQLNSKGRRPEVLCLSLGAGGVGLNLVGANHVFFMDLHWNPQLEAQAQDRVHRFGQTKPVTVTRYISKDTIDENIAALQCTKLQLADGILTNTKKERGGGLSIGQMVTLFGI